MLSPLRRSLLWLLPALLLSGSSTSRNGWDRKVRFSGAFDHAVTLAAGETIEIAAGIEAPSQLPANARIAVEWTAPTAAAGFRKVLHALDPDIYTVYRAPVAGKYVLKALAVIDEKPQFNSARWREAGVVPSVYAFPQSTPWPATAKADMRFSVRPAEFGKSTRGMLVEAEPNNSIDQAQPVPLAEGNDDQTIHITGGADDIEYFDNGLVGESGDDWYRIEFHGTQPRLLTCNLALTDPLIAARLRFYTADEKEYKEGQNANERVHQQVEEHRTEINRLLKPGGVYFLRAEANSPGYEIELRVRKPAPYDDPREAVRQAMYDHLAQVDAWLLNRPRGASVERRIRDSGSLLGTQCMSCHTQSGVWGPAVPMQQGYRAENIQNFRHLTNVMYESLRPTNVLKDAANNTSLAPLDLGDGPAGTRVAGHNVATLERLIAPRKLHSMQQIRTANFVLQSNDPSGINAAGLGSNVGQAVVLNYAGEILKQAWDKTHEQRYFDALEEKADKMLAISVKYTDDLAHRIEFFRRYFPRDYASVKGDTQAARNLMAAIAAQVELDEQRLRAGQRQDGAWGFTPGAVDKKADPAPTALALIAFEALGCKAGDPAVERGAKALLRMQDPYGRWNGSALTGFVTTAYALHALSRLYPENAAAPTRANFEPRRDEPLGDTVGRFRALAQLHDATYVDLMLPGATHASPQVRYWAMIALGAQHEERAVPALVKALGDPVKMVREAARWGLRQTLLDDKGWDETFAASQSKSDLVREQAAAALLMRADATLTKSRVDFPRLTAALNRMMNDDASPAVRAWAMRAAWNWWIWNPPVRQGINEAVLRLLERPEPSVLAANAQRYQLHALFIANGHRANGSIDHQYPELAQLFEAISARLDRPSERLAERIVSVAGTYYSAAGGDGGPGQMGYTTKHSADMVGKAVMAYWDRAEQSGDLQRVRLSLESAANATYEPMQKRLLAFAVNGPDDLKTIAATSVSDPRIISLPATQEFVEPLIEQFARGAADAARRDQLSKPVIRLFTRARWNIPKTEEQQRIFFGLLIPKLDDVKSDAQWYLAEQLGGVIAANPDLHGPIVRSMFPATFRNQLEEYFWLPSVKWMLTEELPLPEIHPASAPSRTALQRRALDLYLKQLAPGAGEKARDIAIRMSPQTELRNNPEVIAALAKVNKDSAARFDAAAYRQPDLNAEWAQNFTYFRDYVVPEMSRINRDDEQACFSCHGVAGRVPSMEMAAPDRFGYLAPQGAIRDYRILLERINDAAPADSKLLRKPLNIQTGNDDGHQGGRRYTPGERGYEIIKTWVEDVARLRRATGQADTGR